MQADPLEVLEGVCQTAKPHALIVAFAPSHGYTGLTTPECDPDLNSQGSAPHAGQVASITVPDQVTQVLARGALEAQVMMLRR
jgi:hypothetical protein